MAEIAFASAAAHAPGLTGWFDKAGPEAQRTVADAYTALGERIRAARLDALVIVANDHILNYNPADYPDFVVGTGARQTGPAEWFKAWLALDDYAMPGYPEVAEGLLRGLGSNNGLRVVENDALQFDDNISVPVTLTRFKEMGIPLVPVIQNCTVPPVPDERQCYAFGQRLAEAIAALPDGLRIGLLGSGGLSHEPGGPRYLEIDDAFDRWFLDLLAEGDHEKVLREATLERMEEAGAGGTAELLAWIVVMGAIGQRPCEVLCYEAVPDWRCGVGAVHWSL